MEKKFIKGILFLTLYFYSVNFIYGQKNNLLFYSNNNYWSVFVFDFINNRYCYSFAKDAFVGSPIYSRGNITRKGDTIIVRSDFDNSNLPINVTSAISNDFNNKINFKFFSNNFDSIRDRITRKRLLYLVINDKDTISLDKDTIRYSNKIDNFYIINRNEYYTYYKTQKYTNSNDNNEFNVSFYEKFNYAFYKTMNDTIILNKSNSKWFLSNEKAYVKLKKTTFTKVKKIIDDCECWNKYKKINLSIDNTLPPVP